MAVEVVLVRRRAEIQPQGEGFLHDVVAVRGDRLLHGLIAFHGDSYLDGEGLDTSLSTGIRVEFGPQNDAGAQLTLSAE